MEKIGLIAGNRKFPLLVCEGAKKNAISVVAIAVKSETSPRINLLAERVYWLKLTDFKHVFTLFKKEGIKKVVMAGQISPWRLFSKEVRNNLYLQEILSNIQNKKADTIFGAIAQKLEEEGLELLDSTLFIREHIPKKGVLTQSGPTKEVWEDINFGFELAKAIGALDIGQTVAVKDKTVIAVEAFEGTDNLIKRAGRLAGKGFVLVKTAKPKQDMRFDIPVVGLNTVKGLIKKGAECLAFEAERTLFIDAQEAIRLADKRGLKIVAV